MAYLKNLMDKRQNQISLKKYQITTKSQAINNLNNKEHMVKTNINSHKNQTGKNHMTTKRNNMIMEMQMVTEKIKDLTIGTIEDLMIGDRMTEEILVRKIKESIPGSYWELMVLLI
jgi:hypothetical protein